MMNDTPDRNRRKQGRQATYNGQPLRGFILSQEQSQQVSMPPVKMNSVKKKVYVPSVWSIIIALVLTVTCGVIAMALAKNTNNTSAAVATPTMQQRINQVVQHRWGET